MEQVPARQDTDEGKGSNVNSKQFGEIPSYEVDDEAVAAEHNKTHDDENGALSAKSFSNQGVPPYFKNCGYNKNGRGQEIHGQSLENSNFLCSLAFVLTRRLNTQDAHRLL